MSDILGMSVHAQDNGKFEKKNLTVEKSENFWIQVDQIKTNRIINTSIIIPIYHRFFTQLNSDLQKNR